MLRPRPRLLVFLPFFGNLIQLLRRVVADVDRFSAIPQSVQNAWMHDGLTQFAWKRQQFGSPSSAAKLIQLLLNYTQFTNHSLGKFVRALHSLSTLYFTSKVCELSKLVIGELDKISENPRKNQQFWENRQKRAETIENREMNENATGTPRSIFTSAISLFFFLRLLIDFLEFSDVWNSEIGKLPNCCGSAAENSDRAAERESDRTEKIGRAGWRIEWEPQNAQEQGLFIHRSPVIKSDVQIPISNSAEQRVSMNLKRRLALIFWRLPLLVWKIFTFFTEELQANFAFQFETGIQQFQQCWKSSKLGCTDFLYLSSAGRHHYLYFHWKKKPNWWQIQKAGYTFIHDQKVRKGNKECHFRKKSKIPK